jgi:hypothetical protein
MLKSLYLISLALTVAIATLPQSKPQTRFITHEEARPLLESLDEVLPAELRGKPAEAQAAMWPEWVKTQDEAVRARLRRGEEDTLVNFLLFGVSFTKQPRVTAQALAERQHSQTQEAFDKVINARIDDLINAFAAPKIPVNNERLLSLRKLVIQQGYQPGDIKSSAKLRKYILVNLRRTLSEQESYTRTIAAA